MTLPKRLTVAGLCGVLTALGCQEAQPRSGPVDIPDGIQVVFKPMTDLLGLPEPIRVAITRDHLPNFSLIPDLSSLDRFIGPLEPSPWFGLNAAMEKELNRPVRFVRSNYRGIRYHLGEGQFDFAMVSATEYAEITRRPVSRIVAVPVNVKGTTEHCGLIIVRKDSKIESLAGLKGKQFAFGPRDDAILHRAALETLAEAGVSEKEIAKSLLPPFGHHMNSFEVAKAVLLEGVPAGVVDELDFENWPEKSSILTQLSVCRDRFRVLARTKPVLEGPIIASVKIDPELFAKMQALLVDKLKGDKSVLDKLHYQGFIKADKSMYQALIDKLGITPEIPSTQPKDDALEPDPPV
ncbi:MAG: phosphate/phosphite/phosphonate ABC transporter substrate-binding protein [Phycisphaerae bacterium]|nr:phosphate/phosphite/phosphonate ABC transporter substrate-binding protein [Phycisphaerae bacterium]